MVRKRVGVGLKTRLGVADEVAMGMAMVGWGVGAVQAVMTTPAVINRNKITTRLVLTEAEAVGIITIPLLRIIAGCRVCEDACGEGFVFNTRSSFNT